MQPPRRAAKMHLFSDRHEVAQLAQFKVHRYVIYIDET
jgi:hypothetical protein